MLIEDYESTGVFTLKVEKSEDSRGVFRKLFDAKLNFPKIEEISFVTNKSRGVLRGLHFQKEPFAESKVIIVLQGEIFDVLVNLDSLRTKNPEIHSFWMGEDHEFQGLVVPPNFAHGYISTSDSSSILYAMDKPYRPEFASGLSWNDPVLGIDWPDIEKKISERDRNWQKLFEME